MTPVSSRSSVIAVSPKLEPSSAPPAGRHQRPLSTRRGKRTAPSSRSRNTIAPGWRTVWEPTFCRSRQRYEPSKGILNQPPSADLKGAGAQVGEQQVEHAGGRVLERLRRIGRVAEADLERLLAVGDRLPFPSPGQKEHREVVGDVAVRIVERVSLGVGEAGDRDQIGLLDDEPPLLPQLVDRGPREAPTLLRRAPRQRPDPVVAAADEQHLPILPLRRHRRPRLEDEVMPDLPPQPPQV